jgi:hypothetical protein
VAIGAPSSVGSASENSGTIGSPISVTVTITAGESGIAFVHFGAVGGAVTGITDSAGNVWTKLGEVTNNGGAQYHSEVWVTPASGALATSSISVAWSGSPEVVSVEAASYPGILAWGNVATNRSGSPSANPTVNLTLQDANNWAICGAEAWDTVNFTYGGTNTFRVRKSDTGASDIIAELFDNTQAGAGSITCTATHGSNEWTIIAVEARSVAGSGPLVGVRGTRGLPRIGPRDRRGFLKARVWSYDISTAVPIVVSDAAPAISTWVVPTVVPSLGGISATPATATATWAVPTVTPTLGNVNAASAPAIATWTVPTVAPTEGGISAAPAPAVSTWVVPSITPALGNISPTIAAAVSTWNVPTVTPGGSGPQTGNPVPAVSSWVVPTVTPQLGGISATITAAVSTWTVNAVTPAIGGLTVSVAAAVRTWAVPSVAPSVGPVTVSLAPAVRTWNVPAIAPGIGPIIAATSPAVSTWVVPFILLVPPAPIVLPAVAWFTPDAHGTLFRPDGHSATFESDQRGATFTPDSES